MTWDTNANNDFWGSILDDLPAELSDDSDNNECHNLYNEPLNWENEVSNVVENDISMGSTHTTVEKMNGKFNLNSICALFTIQTIHIMQLKSLHTFYQQHSINNKRLRFYCDYKANSFNATQLCQSI